MSSEWQTYVNDTRTICKYGSKCYQKNPEHHKTYKHPPKNTKKKMGHNRDNKRYSPYTKEKPKSPMKPAIDEEFISNAVKEIPTKTDNTTEEILTHANASPENYYSSKSDNNLLKELFLVDMPQDFFHFFEHLQQEDNFKQMLHNIDLELIGPYDLLLGKLPQIDNKELYLTHWRFFYDPPEFQAVIKRKGESEYHIGYYRDSPEEQPVFLASNDSLKDCHITPMADNVFGAIYIYLQTEKNKSPFVAMECKKFADKIKKWAEELNYSLNATDVKKRLAKCVTKTLHGAGITVPYDKKTQLGYRPLVEKDATIKKLLAQLAAATSKSEKDKVLSELQPVITYANIAVDECDFGTGLEMGIDLFCSGLKELEPSAKSCLCSAYTLLNRPAFASVIQAHLKHRRKGSKLSIIDLNK